MQITLIRFWDLNSPNCQAMEALTTFDDYKEGYRRVFANYPNCQTHGSTGFTTDYPERKDWLKDKDWVSTVHSLDKLGGGIKSQGNLKITYTSEDEWYALGARYIVVLMSGAILVYR